MVRSAHYATTHHLLLDCYASTSACRANFKKAPALRQKSGCTRTKPTNALTRRRRDPQNNIAASSAPASTTWRALTDPTTTAPGPVRCPNPRERDPRGRHLRLKRVARARGYGRRGAERAADQDTAPCGSGSSRATRATSRRTGRPPSCSGVRGNRSAAPTPRWQTEHARLDGMPPSSPPSGRSSLMIRLRILLQTAARMAPATQVSVSASRLTKSVAATAPAHREARRLADCFVQHGRVLGGGGDGPMDSRCFCCGDFRGGGAKAAQCTSSSSVKEQPPQQRITRRRALVGDLFDPLGDECVRYAYAPRQR